MKAEKFKKKDVGRVVVILAIIVILTVSSLLVSCSKDENKMFNVSGRIKCDGFPLNGVEILINGEQKIYTDESGQFKIENIPEGEGAEICPVSEKYEFYPQHIVAKFARSDADFTANVRKEQIAPVPGIVDNNKIPVPEENLYDGFDNGINPNGKWNIVQGVWGGESNFKGCIPQNVQYTEDGTLILKSKGMYYPNASQRRTGSCIISKEALGPGRIDVAAKISPRLGMCSAIWMYYYEGDNCNHEIDIEFPGKHNGVKGLDTVMCTNYTAVSPNQHSEIYIPGNQSLTAQNDGKWHKYSIEWSVRDKYVKYYIDDVLLCTHTNAGSIPYYKQQLWIGVWEPKNWAGVCDYEESDFLLDWVAYTPFDESENDGVREAKQEFLASRLAGVKSYPKAPYEMSGELNYISNGTFEIDLGAWQIAGNSSSATHIVPLDYTKSNSAMRIKGSGGVYQEISAVYDNYEFNLSADIKAEKIGSRAELMIKFYGADDKIISEQKTEFVENDKFSTIQAAVKAPTGCVKMRVCVEAEGEEGLIFADNIKLIKSYYR